ncbi:stalk domain-containing protein [Paenibacillus beijingensis]|uniref:stalk domain-containing protein n=1 Tax=Paenibacillus beijingensis TaxID=1126833 RepID=UPI000A487053|nr:stalk domain-containing protein [Paenibacillus beijingensis]
MENLSVRVRRRRGGGFRLFVLICFLLAAVAGAWAGYLRFIPNNKHIVPDYGTKHPLFYKGEFLKQGALVREDSVKLPLEAVQDLAGDEEIRYEPDSESVILTTTTKVMRMQTDALTAKMNSKTIKLAFAPESVDGTLYIPLTPLQELYGIQASVSASTGAVTLFKAGDAVQQAAVKKDNLLIREKATIRAPIVDEAPKDADDNIRVWGSGTAGITCRDRAVMRAMHANPISSSARCGSSSPFLTSRLLSLGKQSAVKLI